VFSLLDAYDFATPDPLNYSLYLPLIILLTSSISVATYWYIEHPFLRKASPSAKATLPNA
jgi:hypothetical protein